MGTEVGKAVGEAQSNEAASLSTTSTGKKASMFSKKIGFVIPKNKLSGSLVPVSKATKKGDGDSVNEEAPNKTQRKTKWGPDLSQDTSVRKGRILTYQTRINQISQQLTLGSLEIEEGEDPSSTSEFHDEKSSDHEFNAEKSELLELERREVIGELLKLNPSYKPPAGYKPILKEAKVPIPIKEYPGHDFIGLVYGPANDTQKRLEKETGARIRVFGTKADTGGKVEVTSTDGKDILNTYRDLYVHISADTFEKVDAAVALIELLVTPVSVNPSSSLSTSTPSADENVYSQPSQTIPSPIVTPPFTNQVTRFLPPPQVNIPQYSQPWFSTGPPLLYGPQPIMPRNFSSVPQNPSNVPFSPQLPNPPNRPFISVSPIGTLPSQPLPIRPTQPPVFQATSLTPNPNALSMAIPRPLPLRPSSSDFTFLPHRPPIQNMHSPSTPQPQFLRPMDHNNHMNQPRPQMSTNFPVSPQYPPRHPTFMNPNNPAPFSPHMQPRNNFIPPPAPFHPRLENMQNHRFGAQRFPNSNQPFGNQPRRPFGGFQQNYDPFSPTSIPFNNAQIRGNSGKVQDGSDPEYEDLMASVGVK